MRLSDRSIKIKELLSKCDCDMGTFGLIELELKKFDREVESMKCCGNCSYDGAVFVNNGCNGNCVKLNGKETWQDWKLKKK